MKILAVEHSFPETAYSNAAVIDRVTASSRDFLSFDDLVHSVGFLEQMFQTSGSENRYLGDGRERPIDLVVEASRRALATAGVGPKDLDFVIFGGVTRGFLVPSSASAVQHALGASGASCFDVLDACASWLRALQTADGLFHTGASKVGLIVNCECGNFDDRRIWEIRSLGELDQRGGTYTLGEAATATVVSHTNARSPSSYYSYSFGEFGWEGIDDAACRDLPGSHDDVDHAGTPGMEDRDIDRHAFQRIVVAHAIHPESKSRGG